MRASVEFQEILGRFTENEVDLRAMRKELGDVARERDRYIATVSDLTEQLRQQTVRREQAETIAVRRDNDLADVRARLRAAQNQRDDLYFAAKALGDVRIKKGAAFMVALGVLMEKMKPMEMDVEIPF